MPWIGAGRDVKVVVIGNPTQVAPAAWERTVTDALNGPGWVPDANFTTAPGDSARGNFHIVVVFNGPATTIGQACAGDVDPATLLPGDDAGTILLVLCNETRAVSSVRAWTAPILAPGTPQLRSALAGMLRAALPRYDPGVQGNVGSILFP